MRVDIVMPFLSETMEDGEIVRWIKHVGDHVEEGDELVEIETDKVTTIYESDTTGTLVELLAGEGDRVPCGQPVAVVETHRS